jgi:hypothetical protein
MSEETMERYNVPKSLTERRFKMLRTKVIVEKTKLDYGDYRLKEYPECCVIERKAGLLELYKNLMVYNDKVRQARSFRKLCACEHPYLLVEASPSELLSPNKRIENPEIVVANLCMVIAKYGFHILWIPWGTRSPSTRRKLGTLMIHIMLACALKRKIDIMPELV